MSGVAAKELAQMRATTFEPYTLFRVPPTSGPNLNVSAAGYRHGAQPLPWPPGPESIFVFGGSTAFGYGVSDAETIPSQLGEQTGAFVYNFASPNYSSVQERIRFEQLLLDGHRPRIAVFIDGFSDFIAPYYEPVVFARFRDEGRGLLRGLRRRKMPERRVPDPAAVIERYLANARLIRGACSEFGVRPLFVWQPVPCYAYDGPSEDHGEENDLVDCVRKGYELMAGRFGNIAGFLWLADLQRGRKDRLYIDADHYTAAFSHDIAAEIARHLA